MFFFCEVMKHKVLENIGVSWWAPQQLGQIQSDSSGIWLETWVRDHLSSYSWCQKGVHQLKMAALSYADSLAQYLAQWQLKAGEWKTVTLTALCPKDYSESSWGHHVLFHWGLKKNRWKWKSKLFKKCFRNCEKWKSLLLDGLFIPVELRWIYKWCTQDSHIPLWQL